MEKLKLAIIGCGAVAEVFHLPSSKLTDKISVTVLVDASLSRAQQLAQRFDIPHVSSEYLDVIGKADAALVALPNYLHAPVSIDLLQRGIHVLVEKPMALRTEECSAMIEAASTTKTVLAVGLVRRFYDSVQYVRQVLVSGFLGKVQSFDFREGGVFRWSAASDSVFRKEIAGGGVLADVGAHVLDLLLFWLGDYEHVEYFDDALGGVEADSEIHLRLQNGATGIVELSRTRKLRNTYIIRGERGTLEIENEFDPMIRLTINGQEFVLAGKISKRNSRGRIVENGWPVLDAFRYQFDDLAVSVLKGRPPSVPGDEGRRAISLIEECYASKQPLPQPWLPGVTSAREETR